MRNQRAKSSHRLPLFCKESALDQLRLSYMKVKLCKSNAEKNYVSTQNKHLTDMLNPLYRKNGEKNIIKQC